MNVMILLSVVFAGIYLGAILMSLWIGKGISRFLERNTEISGAAVLEEFKGIARRSMYLALMQIPAFGLGLILGVVLIFRYGLVGFLGVMAANVVLLVCGVRLGNLEKQARSLPAANERLAQEHQRVSKTWVRKALPNF